MKREFTLEEVFDLDEFNGYKVRIGRAPIQSRDSPRPSRFFLIQDHVTYPDIGSIIRDTPDNPLYISSIWVPGQITDEQGRQYTAESREEYFMWLVNQEQKTDINHIVVQVAQQSNSRNHTDFDYHREGELFELQSLFMKKSNFKFYTFNGIRPPSKNQTSSIFGIHLPHEATSEVTSPTDYRTPNQS